MEPVQPFMLAQALFRTSENVHGCPAPLLLFKMHALLMRWRIGRR
jgi:hypothetical protein